ncbi:WD40 repeat domain-containing protein [Cupriavidus necator]|uniref:WD40 repeat domain-containing protein n=1 Tax=Cupriavidus necator TaxID=106590 RepID=UPI0039C375EB
MTTARDGAVDIWSVDGPKHVETIAFHAPKPRIYDAVFSPNGMELLLTSESNQGGSRRAWIWRKPFKVAQDWPADGEIIEQAKFSKDGRWVISVRGDGVATIREASTQRVVKRFPGAAVRGAELSANSRWLLTWSADGVQVWDTVDAGTAVSLSGLPPTVRGRRIYTPNRDFRSAISPDRRLLLALDADEHAHIWDIATGDLRATLGSGEGDHRVSRTYFSPGGERVITIGRDKSVRVRDARSGKEILALRTSSDAPIGDFSDGTHIWILDGEKIGLWGLDGKEITKFSIADKDPDCVSASPDGHWLALCSQAPESGNKRARPAMEVYDLRAKSGPVVLGGHDTFIKDIFFSHDGRFVVSAETGQVARIWKAGAWRKQSTRTFHGAGVVSATFDPQGKSFAAVDEANTVRVFSSETGRQTSIAEMRGHKGRILAMAFSADGNWLATGGEDAFVRVWDTKTGRPVAEFHGHFGEVIAVAFVKEGDSVITAGADGAVRSYRCSACVPAAELIARAQKQLKAIGRELSESERSLFLQAE